jgi:hypothetical protein
MNLFNATVAAMMDLAASASVDDVDMAEAAAIMVSPAPPVPFYELISANSSKRELLEKGVMAFLDDWRYQARKLPKILVIYLRFLSHDQYFA